MKRTVFKVILRKSEYKEQWSLLIESFPVFESGKDKPLRKHEPLGLFITTLIFDKNSSGRTLADGKAYYRPKRDANGIILCRSQKDQEACIFADKVRDPQREQSTYHRVLYARREPENYRDGFGLWAEEKPVYPRHIFGAGAKSNDERKRG